MKKDIVKKSLVIGIIFLFFEASLTITSSSKSINNSIISSKPFEITGTCTWIDEGEVAQIGNSFWYYCKNRSCGGEVFGSIGGTEGELYSFDFEAVTHLLSQMGPIWGFLNFEEYKAFVIAFSSIAIIPYNKNIELGMIFIGGFSFTEGVQGNGRMSGWIIPELTEDGHIKRIKAGGLNASGKWIPSSYTVRLES